MKNCKRRTIFSWIFAFVLLIPMFSIAIRCLYVVINKNAYQSYYASEVNAVTYVNVGNDFNYGERYMMTCGLVSYTETQSEVVFSVRDFSSEFLTDAQNQSINVIRVRSQNNATFCLFYNNSTYVSDRGFADNNVYQFEFVFLNKNTNTLLPQYQTVYDIVYSNNGYLDNVFEYSIQSFVDKHGNGLINFFGLLEQYFMQSTTANALYFTFANWCLNYVLLVSCVWLLFSVLMWFINYCNYMLNTSFRKGHGD